MKKKIIALCICVCLTLSVTACSQRNNTKEPEVSQSQSVDESPSMSSEQEVDSELPASSEEARVPKNDTFYPIGSNTSYKWLNGGNLLAVPNNGTIQYIDLDNQLVNTVVIPPDKLIGGYRLEISDNRIMVMGVYDYNGQKNAGYMCVCFTDGEWVLANGSIWDNNGNLLREFLRLQETSQDAGLEHWGTLPDGRIVQKREDVCIPEDRVYWLSDDLIALGGQSRLFFYNLSTDVLTLVDDMSGWVQDVGKMQSHLGIVSIMPAANGIGCYYFAHKNEKKWNEGRTVWYADESGIRELFGGQEFSRVIYGNGMLIMIKEIDNPATAQTEITRLWYATDDDLTLREIDSWDGMYTIERATKGYIALIGWIEPYRFYIIDTADATVSSYVPQIENCTQYEILGVRNNDGSIQYIYTTFIEGETGYYLYDTETDTNWELDTKPFLFRDEVFHEPTTHFVERYPNKSYEDMFNTTDVRIREIK